MEIPNYAPGFSKHMGRVTFYNDNLWRGLCSYSSKLDNRIVNLICQQTKLGNAGTLLRKYNLSNLHLDHHGTQLKF